MILIMTFDSMADTVNDFLEKNDDLLCGAHDSIMHVYVSVISLEQNSERKSSVLTNCKSETIIWTPDFDYVQSLKDDLPFSRSGFALWFDSDYKSVNRIAELLEKSTRVIIVSWINGSLPSIFALESAFIASKKRIPITVVGLMPFRSMMSKDGIYVCRELQERRYKLRLTFLDKCWEKSKKRDKNERLKEAIEMCERDALKELEQELIADSENMNNTICANL